MTSGWRPSGGTGARVGDSAAGPEAFSTFEALTVAGDLLTGDVAITLIPEPHSAALVALGLGALLARARRMEERR